ncbi:hypothetical protein [uncultured Oscillibacter sp.]|uniref:hypothetical protein n=1 Tax=uncultured Oscillibacter sp. TaxID=876091 RepID=UPI0025EDDBF7|nr:hypothetical protein [uncultured Oscillibacter sp.]
MPNENLIPFDKRTEEEQRRIASDGGKASGAARRRKRSLKDAADLYLSLPVSDRRRWNKIARRGIDPEDVDNQMAMIIGLTEAATQGDAKAAKVIVDLLGDTANNSGGAIEDDPITKSLKETINAVTETDQDT